MDWTEEQKQAINTRGKNMLIAAAAGSGKTAVLIQRIYDVITTQTDIDRLLVVTFTKAAAGEMSARLYKKLSEALADPTIDSITKEKIRRQLILLSNANITTIHSFCQKIIKNNFKESGVDPSAAVSEEKEAELIKQKSLDSVLSKYYEEYSDVYDRLLDIYGTYNSDFGLRECILQLDAIAGSCVDPEGWLKEQLSYFENEAITDFMQTKWGKEFVGTLKIALEAFCAEFERLVYYSENIGGDIYTKCLKQDYQNLIELNKTFQNESLTWKELFEATRKLSFGKLPSLTTKLKESMPPSQIKACEFIKDQRTKSKKNILDQINAVFSISPDIPIEDVKVTRQEISCLVNIVSEYRQEYKEQKKKNNILDFDDLEHIAYNTLINNADVAEYYRDAFDEIYVDEYQDTSEIQEAILTCVSRKQHNMFMVGDVKQSIYSFRQARPDIFLGKYKKYANDDGVNKLILLSSNFRSSKGVVDSVNHVFSSIMNERTCDMDYTEKEYLRYGATGYDAKQDDAPVELHIIPKDSNESEMLLVASRIKELVDSRYQIIDLKTGTSRDIQYSDIVILLRSLKNKAQGYATALTGMGIPVYYQEGSGFFESGEINVLLSFLYAIDNPLQDIHFVSVMRNIYGFTDSELARIKKFYTDTNEIEKKQQFFKDATTAYAAGNSGVDSRLANKARLFTDRFASLCVASETMGVSELLWTLMHENHFYDNLMASPDREFYKKNINVFLNRTINYDKNTNKGLYNFLKYYDNLKSRNIDISGGGYSATGNCVNIVSIHKSKGLEFPVVFLCDTGKKFNFTDINKRLVVHRELGIGPTCYNRKQKALYSSVMKECIRQKYDHDIRAEEMRVLYVAMTRAKEKLIITGKAPYSSADIEMQYSYKCHHITGKPMDYHILRADRFLDWIACSYIYEKDSKILINILNGQEDTDPEDEIDETLPDNTVSFLPLATSYEGEKIISSDSNKANQIMPLKISVTDIKRILDAFEENVTYIPEKKIEMKDVPDFHKDNSNISEKNRNQGTLLHLCLQMLNYNAITQIVQSDFPREKAAEYIDEIILELQDKMYISQEEAALINRDILIKYVLSEFAMRLAKADDMVREKNFTMSTFINGQEVTVQGIMDCIIKEGDKVTLIDFKSDYLGNIPNKENFINHALEYKTQICTYAECIKKLTGKEPGKLVYFLRYNESVDFDQIIRDE